MLLGVVLEKARIRKKRPRNSSPGGLWASYSGPRPGILDLDLDLRRRICVAIISSSILRASQHDTRELDFHHPFGPILQFQPSFSKLPRYLHGSFALTLARTKRAEPEDEREHPCRQDRRKVLRVQRAGRGRRDIPSVKSRGYAHPPTRGDDIRLSLKQKKNRSKPSIKEFDRT